MNRERVVPRLVLAFILLVALGFRLNNIGFGLPSMYDPDEPIFMITALRLLGEGTLNPGWFGHPGSTTIYLIATIDALIAKWGLLVGNYSDVADFARAAYANPALLFVPARVAMALFGTTSVALTYAIGKRLQSPMLGLVAAALLAVNALHIEWSQVIRTDVQAGTFVLAAIAFALRYADKPTIRDLPIAGAFVGLAIATKWPCATAFLAIPGAYAVARSRGGQWIHLALACLAAPVALVLASPYLLLDWQTVLANVGGEIRPGHLSQNGIGLVGNMGRYLAASLGPVGTVLALVGTLVASVRSPGMRLIVLPVAAGFMLLIASQDIYWSRWVLPILPILCLLVGFAATCVGGLVGKRIGGWSREAVVAGMAAAVAIPSIANASAAASERANDTRSRAAQWAERHIPAGSSVAFEHLELSVRDQPWTIKFPVGSVGCIDGARASRVGVNFTSVQKARHGSTIVNLGTLPPNRIESCRSDFAVLTYYDRYVAERHRYRDELATYRAVLRGGRTIALFRPRAGVSGGPVVRIVRMPPARPSVASRGEFG